MGLVDIDTVWGMLSIPNLQICSTELGHDRLLALPIHTSSGDKHMVVRLI